MAEIKHTLVIKTARANVYAALTTAEGLSKWFAKITEARPEPGYINTFIFGGVSSEMKIVDLVANKKIEWLCVKSVSVWTDTTISFELEEQADTTLLRFSHSGYKEINDTFASCNYDWATFLRSLKSYCETGYGTPA